MYDKWQTKKKPEKLEAKHSKIEYGLIDFNDLFIHAYRPQLKILYIHIVCEFICIHDRMTKHTLTTSL